MSTVLKHRRGLEAALPALAEAEFWFSKDTHKLFIGSAVGNQSIRGNYVTPEMYGWQPGLSDAASTAAIQAAIDSVKGTIDGEGGGASAIKSTPVLLPEGIHQISQPIIGYSGIRFLGQGRGATIKEGAGFVGTELIQLQAINGRLSYCADVEIGHMKFVSSTVGVAAIHNKGTAQNDVAAVLSCNFHDIWLYTTDGIILDSYTQGCVLENIKSYGNINRLVEIRGNWNSLRNIQKEALTGTLPGAYIYGGPFNLNQAGPDDWHESEGNTLDGILIEGIGSVNKHPVELYRMKNTRLRDVWFEATSSDGYGLKIIDCKDWVEISGINQMFLTSDFKLIISNSDPSKYQNLVLIDALYLNNGAVKLSDYVTIDDDSTLIIDKLYTRDNQATASLSNLKNIRVGTCFGEKAITQIGAAPGISPLIQQRWIHGQNLLKNGSFEGGVFGWLFEGSMTPTFQASEVGPGLMLKTNSGATTSGWLKQEITVPAAWVGQTMTLSLLAKGTGSISTSLHMMVYDCGLALVTGYNRFFGDLGWGICTISFTPLAAGTLTVGVFLYGLGAEVDWYLDETVLAFGTEALLGAGRFTQLEVGSNSIIFGSTAPTTGTWKQGDICWKTTPSALGTPGWVCTTAGTPGTWSNMPSLV